jgi:hypothetical protein
MDDHPVRRVQHQLHDLSLPLRQLLSGHSCKELDANVRRRARLAVFRLLFVQPACPQMSAIPHRRLGMSAIPLGHLVVLPKPAAMPDAIQAYWQGCTRHDAQDAA